MQNKIILGILLLLAVINIIVFFQIKSMLSISKSEPSAAAAAAAARCPADPISECYDPYRFPGTVHQGNTWVIEDMTRKKYSDDFYDKFKTNARAVFVSKKVLNKIFADDKTATGIICTFAYEDGRVGLVVQSGLSDSTEIAPMPTSFNDKVMNSLVEILGVSVAKAGTVGTSQIFYSKIYCPPQCPSSDSTAVDSTRKSLHKKTAK